LYCILLSDKLVERVIISNDDTIIEYFLPGRSHGLKEHIIVGERTKEMHFYPEARNDGLYKRVDLPNKVKYIYYNSNYF